MTNKVYVLVTLCLGAAVAIGMSSAGSNSPIVEVKQELPIRVALQGQDLASYKTAYQQERDFESEATNSLFPDDISDALPTPDTDVFETASKFEKFSVLVAAFKRSGLLQDLKSTKSITIFAPTNRAFSELPAPVLEELLKPENSSTLRKIIADHIVPKKVLWSELFGRKTRLRTIGGSFLNVDGTHGVRVNGVRLEISDVLATNGVVHVIDRLVNRVPERLSVM